MGFGNPNNGNGNGNFKPFPKNFPKAGEPYLTVRILPPIHSCENTGDWFVGHTQHWGYSVPRANDPSKKVIMSFRCIEETAWRDGSRVVTKVCPECAEIALKRAEFNAAEARLKQEGRGKEEIKKTLEPLQNWLFSHNKDFKFYMNVKFLDGSYGTLRVPSKVKKMIDSIRNDLRNGPNKYDIVAADQGYWLVLGVIEGRGAQTVYKCEVMTENVVINGDTYQKPKKAPLTPEDAEKAEAVCYDLRHIGIRRLAADKIQMLVESHGEINTVKAIFGSSERLEKSEATSDDEGGEEEIIASNPFATPAPTPAPQKAAPAPVAAPKPVPEPVVEDDEVAAAERLLAAAKAAKAAKTAKAAAKPAPAPAPVPVQTSFSDLVSDAEADFMKQFSLDD